MAWFLIWRIQAPWDEKAEVWLDMSLLHHHRLFSEECRNASAKLNHQQQKWMVNKFYTLYIVYVCLFEHSSCYQVCLIKCFFFYLWLPATYWFSVLSYHLKWLKSCTVELLAAHWFTQPLLVRFSLSLSHKHNDNRLVREWPLLTVHTLNQNTIIHSR